ncbi:hypothetical protein Hdeb2414_s0724g00939931 [Helianthus debilis subsp. tardiflorus]
MNNNNNNNDDDNWVKSAIDDVNLVVHLLLKLRHPSPPPPKTWTIRQRRSRPPPPPPTTTTTNKPSATRASPTTPLSWSGATSVSGGGVEESSRLIHDGSETRSKVCYFVCCVFNYVTIRRRFPVLLFSFSLFVRLVRRLVCYTVARGGLVNLPVLCNLTVIPLVGWLIYGWLLFMIFCQTITHFTSNFTGFSVL